MQKLGANAIRVYHVDPTGDHSGCMSAFAEAGIYLFVDLDTFDTQINQVRAMSVCWDFTAYSVTFIRILLLGIRPSSQLSKPSLMNSRSTQIQPASSLVMRYLQEVSQDLFEE